VHLLTSYSMRNWGRFYAYFGPVAVLTCRRFDHRPNKTAHQPRLVQRIFINYSAKNKKKPACNKRNANRHHRLVSPQQQKPSPARHSCLVVWHLLPLTNVKRSSPLHRRCSFVLHHAISAQHTYCSAATAKKVLCHYVVSIAVLIRNQCQ